MPVHSFVSRLFMEVPILVRSPSAVQSVCGVAHFLGLGSVPSPYVSTHL